MSGIIDRNWIWIAPNPKPPVALTKRQNQVLYLIASGCRTKEIAYKLGLKPETVNIHILAIRKKLDAKTNAHAVFIASEILFIQVKL